MYRYLCVILLSLSLSLSLHLKVFLVHILKRRLVWMAIPILLVKSQLQSCRLQRQSPNLSLPRPRLAINQPTPLSYPRPRHSPLRPHHPSLQHSVLSRLNPLLLTRVGRLKPLLKSSRYCNVHVCIRVIVYAVQIPSVYHIHAPGYLICTTCTYIYISTL